MAQLLYSLFTKYRSNWKWSVAVISERKLLNPRLLVLIRFRNVYPALRAMDYFCPITRFQHTKDNKLLATLLLILARYIPWFRRTWPFQLGTINATYTRTNPLYLHHIRLMSSTRNKNWRCVQQALGRIFTLSLKSWSL